MILRDGDIKDNHRTYRKSNNYVFYYIYFNQDGFEQRNQYTSEDEFRSDEEVLSLNSDDVEQFNYVPDNYEVLYLDRKKAHPNTFGKCIMEFSAPIENCLLFGADN